MITEQTLGIILLYVIGLSIFFIGSYLLDKAKKEQWYFNSEIRFEDRYYRITGLCVLGFVLTPFNMIYRSKRYRVNLILKNLP